MTYRADIDGMRAVAVLAVVLFHAEIAGFSGGFVGVDVFFVISGFLITGIIYSKLEAGKFSLVEFWERRVRRIAPAMLLMAAAVVLFTLLFKTPNEARLFGESLSFFGLLASNHFFLQERGYFDASTEAFALLHTWSLAVEEQFYLIFPPLLALLFAQWRGRLKAVLALLAFASFVAASVIVIRSIGDVALNSDLAFYFTPLRMWELLLGAMLAIARPDPNILSRGLRETLALLGLALIGAAVLFYDQTTPFPGPSALAPCIGAALLIYTGGAETSVRRLLSWGPLVFIGLASYSFYLWHWPALSFAEYYAMRKLSDAEALITVAVSFGVAILSLFYVERPFRAKGGVLGRRPLFLATAAVFIGAIALGVALQKTRGLPQRFSPEVLALTTGDSHQIGVDLRDCPGQRDRLTKEQKTAIYVMFCKVGDTSKTPKILLWGDSHALSVSPAFQQAALRNGDSVLVTSRVACAPVVGYKWPTLTTWRGCVAHNQAVLDAVARLEIRTVILVASWGGNTNDSSRRSDPQLAQSFQRHLRGTISALQSKGVEVRILSSVPVYSDFHIPSAVHRAAVFGRKTPIDLSREAHEAVQEPEKSILLDAAAEFGANMLKLDDFFCDAKRCKIVDRMGNPLYSDNSHLNLRGARQLTPLIEEWIWGG